MRVLLVEDETTLATAIARALSLDGFAVDLSDNGIAHADPDGLDLGSLEQARSETFRGLAEMARDQKPIADEQGDGHHCPG